MAEKIRDVKQLDVWKKGHKLVLCIYDITRGFPREEKYGLVSQMRRAAVSIPANVAEGFKKFGSRDKIKFYNISQGSLEELDYYYLLTKDLNYISDNIYIDELIRDVKKLLSGLIRSIKT